MAASMSASTPRRKSGAVTSRPKDTGGAELHNPAKRSEDGAEASGFDGAARLGRTGHKERTTWCWVSLNSEGCRRIQIVVSNGEPLSPKTDKFRHVVGGSGAARRANDRKLPLFGAERGASREGFTALPATITP